MRGAGAKTDAALDGATVARWCWRSEGKSEGENAPASREKAARPASRMETCTKYVFGLSC
jgi:hypothetical protein